MENAIERQFVVSADKWPSFLQWLTIRGWRLRKEGPGLALFVGDGRQDAQIVWAEDGNLMRVTVLHRTVSVGFWDVAQAMWATQADESEPKRGRRAKVNRAECAELARKGIPAKALAKRYGVTVSRVYGVLREEGVNIRE